MSAMEQAREQGDRLIVAVNGDASVTPPERQGDPLAPSIGVWPCWLVWRSGLGCEL